VLGAAEERVSAAELSVLNLAIAIGATMIGGFFRRWIGEIRHAVWFALCAAMAGFLLLVVSLSAHYCEPVLAAAPAVYPPKMTYIELAWALLRPASIAIIGISLGFIGAALVRSFALSLLIGLGLFALSTALVGVAFVPLLIAGCPV
jgi:hypothetical protein